MLETLENFWSQLHSQYPRYALDCLLPTAVAIVCYVVFNIPFLILDLIGCPKFLLKFKVQQNMNVPVKSDLVLKALKTIGLNIFIIGALFMNFLYFVRLYRGCYVGPKLPTVTDFLTQAIIIVLFNEFAFYYGHRFFHTSWMYKRFHKKHHEWTSPISIVSVYCHPLEHVLVNLGSVGLGPVVAKADTVTTIIWYLAAFFATTCHHSGYDFPFTPSPRFHDYHHEKNANNGCPENLMSFEHPDFASSIEAVQKNGELIIALSETEGFKAVISGESKIALATTDIKSAVDFCDVMMMIVPAFGQLPIFEMALPYLRDDQIIVNMPGNFASLQYAEMLQSRGVQKRLYFADTDSIPYACRKVKDNQVFVSGIKLMLNTGVYPAEATDKVLGLLQPLFTLKLEKVNNVLAAGFANMNMIVHPPPVLLNAGWIEVTKGNFSFYQQGCSPSICRVMDAIDAERDGSFTNDIINI